jgi:hypothetical protein
MRDCGENGVHVVIAPHHDQGRSHLQNVLPSMPSIERTHLIGPDQEPNLNRLVNLAAKELKRVNHPRHAASINFTLVYFSSRAPLKRKLEHRKSMIRCGGRDVCLVWTHRCRHIDQPRCADGLRYEWWKCGVRPRGWIKRTAEYHHRTICTQLHGRLNTRT